MTCARPRPTKGGGDSTSPRRWRIGSSLGAGLASFACALAAVGGLAATGAPGASAVPVGHLTFSEAVAQRLVLQEINAVRKRFGLPAAYATRAYQSTVNSAAHRNEDPFAPFPYGVVEEYGVWGLATAISPSLAADVNVIVDNWVYHDGWEGSATRNLDCTSPTAPGCNGHRRAILSRAPVADARLYIDAAVVPTRAYGGSALSIAVLLFWQA